MSTYFLGNTLMVHALQAHYNTRCQLIWCIKVPNESSSQLLSKKRGSRISGHFNFGILQCMLFLLPLMFHWDWGMNSGPACKRFFILYFRESNIRKLKNIYMVVNAFSIHWQSLSITFLWEHTNDHVHGPPCCAQLCFRDCE